MDTRDPLYEPGYTRPHSTRCCVPAGFPDHRDRHGLIGEVAEHETTGSSAFELYLESCSQWRWHDRRQQLDRSLRGRHGHPGPGNSEVPGELSLDGSHL